jgi:hypothetical protein
VRDEQGKLSGLGEKGARAYAKFKATLKRMAVGETLEFEWHEPRSPGYHRLFFARLHALFDRQEQFADVDALRAWLTVGAGECDFLPGPRGRMVAMPRSIAWHRLDEVEFREIVRKIDDFIDTDHAQVFLWPHLKPRKRAQMVYDWRSEFDRG